MGDFLRDPYTNRGMRIDEGGRGHVHSFGVTMIEAAVIAGDSYTVNSGLIELTDDSDSGIFYIKNTSNEDFLIYEQNIIIAPSTGGVGPSLLSFHGQITGGTVLTDEDSVPAVNARIQEPDPLDANTYKGGQGKTFESGQQATFPVETTNTSAPLCLPALESIGISIQPPTGNTSQVVSYGISLISKAKFYGAE